MRLARQAARAGGRAQLCDAAGRGGFKDAKVVARFPTEGTDEASYLDLSTPYEQAIKEAERPRAPKGRNDRTPQSLKGSTCSPRSSG